MIQDMNIRLFRRMFNRRGWQTTNNAWRFGGGRAFCVPTLGAELFVNGGFDADTNWTKETGWTISAGKTNHAGATAGTLYQAVATIGGWYQLQYLHESGATNFTAAYFGTTTNLGAGVTNSNETVVSVKRQLSTASAGLRASTSTVVQADNASLKQLTLSDMFATIPNQNTTASIEARLVTVGGTAPRYNQVIGVSGWLDSTATPSNFLIAYMTLYNSTRYIALDKCVGGTYTNLINTAVTYLPNAPLKLVGTRSGGNLLVDVTYNGAAVGTQQTVADAGIVSNTNHGLFSGSQYNLFTGFSIT